MTTPATDYRVDVAAANLEEACRRIRGDEAERALVRIRQALELYTGAAEAHLATCRYARGRLTEDLLEEHLETALAADFQQLALAMVDELGGPETQRLLGIVIPPPLPAAPPEPTPRWWARVARKLRGRGA